MEILLKALAALSLMSVTTANGNFGGGWNNNHWSEFSRIDRQQNDDLPPLPPSLNEIIDPRNGLNQSQDGFNQPDGYYYTDYPPVPPPQLPTSYVGEYSHVQEDTSAFEPSQIRQDIENSNLGRHVNLPGHNFSLGGLLSHGDTLLQESTSYSGGYSTTPADNFYTGLPQIPQRMSYTNIGSYANFLTDPFDLQVLQTHQGIINHSAIQAQGLQGYQNAPENIIDQYTMSAPASFVPVPASSGQLTSTLYPESSERHDEYVGHTNQHGYSSTLQPLPGYQTEPLHMTEESVMPTLGSSHFDSTSQLGDQQSLSKSSKRSRKSSIIPSKRSRGSSSSDKQDTPLEDYPMDPTPLTIGYANRMRNTSEETEEEIDRLTPPEGCNVHVTKLSALHGVLTDDNFEKVIYPNYNDYFIMEDGQIFGFYCPPNQWNGDESTMRSHRLNYKLKRDRLNLKCVKGIIKNMSTNHMFNIYEFKCNVEPFPTMQTSSSPCEPGVDGNVLEKYEVGVQTMSWNKLSEVCVRKLNTGTLDVMYVRTELGQSLRGQEVSDVPYDFITPNNSPVNGNELGNMYSRRTNIRNLRIQLFYNLNHGYEMYQTLTQTNDNRYFITQGHLAGRFDHVYLIEQKSSFFWSNIKPMWSNLKQNWGLVEVAVSKLAAYRIDSVTVFSGTYGVMKHENGKRTISDLYLGFMNDKLYQAIPELFWKVLFSYNPQTGASCVAVVGHNTPYEVFNLECTRAPVSWLNLESNQENGFVYTCACQSFKPEIINSLPISKFGVQNFALLNK